MSTPDVVSNGVSFEVERFEWVDGDRLEVTGRWYGLRGPRFVRPVPGGEGGGRVSLAALWCGGGRRRSGAGGGEPPTKTRGPPTPARSGPPPSPGRASR